MEIDGNEIIGNLIAGDMRAHLADPTDGSAFCASPYAATWILTAFAELHSNAQKLAQTIRGKMNTSSQIDESLRGTNGYRKRNDLL